MEYRLPTDELTRYERAVVDAENAEALPAVESAELPPVHIPRRGRHARVED